MSKAARDRKRQERTSKRVTRNLQRMANRLRGMPLNVQTWVDVTEETLTPGDVFTVRGVYIVNPDPHS